MQVAVDTSGCSPMYPASTPKVLDFIRSSSGELNFDDALIELACFKRSQCLRHAGFLQNLGCHLSHIAATIPEGNDVRLHGTQVTISLGAAEPELHLSTP